MTAYTIYNAVADDLKDYFKKYLCPEATDIVVLRKLAQEVKKIGEKKMSIRISLETATAVAMAYVEFHKACRGDYEKIAGYKISDSAQACYELVEIPLSHLAAREGYIQSESGREIPFVVARQQMNEEIWLKVRRKKPLADLQSLYDAYCDAFRKVYGALPQLERYYMTADEAEKMDPETRSAYGIYFYTDDDNVDVGVFNDDHDRCGITLGGKSFETTEYIDFKELYYSDDAGPVYKGYPIQTFIKGPWHDKK